MTKPVINLDDLTLADFGNGAGFSAKLARIAPLIGSGIGCSLHVVEPGSKAFPFHAHYQTQELFIVLDGEGTYRFGDKSYPIRKNDVLAAPAGGAEVAHQIINTGDEPLRYLGISSNPGNSDVVEYPDSGKFAVSGLYDKATGTSALRYVGRRENTLSYWDGEE